MGILIYSETLLIDRENVWGSVAQELHIDVNVKQLTIDT